MPQQIELSGNRSIQNMYATDGRKLKTTVKEGEELMDGTKYYNANFVFDKQKEMDYILFDEGRIVNYGGNLEYEYHLKDHLGSVRVAFVPTTSGTEIVQENAYYPFGGTIDDFSYNASENRYKHTGMEAIDDFGLNMLDNNARWRDVSAVPRFYGIDPLAEMYYSISPYAYCGNDPVNFIDKTGLYRMNAKDQKKYPVLTSYLKTGIGEILNSHRIMSALQKHGSFSKQDIYDKIIKWNSGIEIMFVEFEHGAKGAAGYYMGGVGKPISINKLLADQLENATADDFHVMLLILIKSIFHESIHFGDWADGIPNYEEEVGRLFEADVYHNGSLWDAYTTGSGLTKAGIEEWRKILENKSQTEEDKVDLPGTSWADFYYWLEEVRKRNPNIKVKQ